MADHLIMIKPSHIGLLHESLGIDPKRKIGMAELMRTKNRAKKTGNTKEEREATFALNMNK